MDNKKLIIAYNTLNEAVGKNGAFIILCSSMTDGAENVRILSDGPLVLNLGLLASMVPVAQDQLLARLDEKLKAENPKK